MLPRDLAVMLSDGLEDATHRVAFDLKAGDVGDEDDFSSQLCGRLKAAAEGVLKEALGARPELPDGSRERVRLRARHLRSRGKRSEETRIGADIVMVLDVDLPDQRVIKGLFIQAKMLSPGEPMPSREWGRLQEQCDRMLRLTPAAFVLMYSNEGVRAFSASAIEATQQKSLWDSSTYPINWLFHDFFISWIGDRRITGTDSGSLSRLLDLYGVPNALILQFHSSPDTPDRWRETPPDKP